MYDDLVHSIMKACRILGKEFNEVDVPSNPNAYTELTKLNTQLWSKVRAKNAVQSRR
jgi:hypothetical protein